MIILEGIEQSGKRTLAHKLALRFDLPLYSYERQLRADGHYRIDDINSDLLTWEKKPTGIYIGHPLIDEYIYGPLHRKRVLPEFYHWDVRPMIRYFQDEAIFIYCRPDSLSPDNDPATPFFDLLFRTPLLNLRVWEYDFTNDPEAKLLVVPLTSYLNKADLDHHHRKIGSRFHARRKLFNH